MAAIGNAFHAVVVAILLDLWMMEIGERSDLKGAAEILRHWHQMMQHMSEEGVDDPGCMDLPMIRSISEEEAEEKILQLEPAGSVPKSLRMSGKALEERGQELATRLVHEYLRRTEFRGSDVRLDLGVIYRPDMSPRTTIDPRRWKWTVGSSYAWRKSEHINVLELRAVLNALEWRSRSKRFRSKRFLHLSDSQVCLSVLTKGRSSSRKLNRILRRISALCLSLNLFPIYAWIASRLNPADEPSRRYEQSIRLGKTKQERQVERRRLGKLSSNLVSTSTEQRYLEAFDAFVEFTRSSNEDLWNHPTQVDKLMCTYIENLWESGDAKTCANYTVAGLQYVKPQLKQQLPMSWKLISTGNKLEQPCRATPLAMSIAGSFIQWQWPRLGYLCMVGFSGFLRTGEMFKLLKKHVVAAPDKNRPSILFLVDTKTAQRNQLLWEKDLIHGNVAKVCLEELCRGLQPQDALCDVHPEKFLVALETDDAALKVRSTRVYPL